MANLTPPAACELPEFRPGVVVRVPLADLHDFLERNGLEIVGRLAGPEARRLVVKLAPVGTRGEILRPGGASE